MTEASRNERTPDQPFLLELTARDENSVSAECAICARLNAFEAVADKAGREEKKQCLRTSDSADIIPQDQLMELNLLTGIDGNRG